MLTEICHEINGNKRAHWVLVLIMGSGSGEQQNLANVFHYMKSWAQPAGMWHQYKLLKGVLQDVLLRGISDRGYFCFFFFFFLWKVVCSISELTSWADSRRQWRLQWANIWDLLRANQICKPLLSNIQVVPPWKNVKQDDFQQSYKILQPFSVYRIVLKVWFSPKSQVHIFPVTCSAIYPTRLFWC